MFSDKEFAYLESVIARRRLSNEPLHSRHQ